MKIVDVVVELAFRIAILVVGIGLALFPDPIPIADEAVITVGTGLIQLAMESEIAVLDEFRRSVVNELPPIVRGFVK